MSQTLSLEPGKYALYIAPPVAGVDYTGTPLPSVSYQWRKNGVAIAGQTDATISGVWVEQTGGTVDLVDGDVISIDIILTNPVSVATKTISATIDTAIPAPIISPVSVRQLSGGTYQTVTSLANTDIGEQVIVASNTGGTVTTTPPVLTTYQWRRNSIQIAGATAQDYTLQAADADSIIDCVVRATNSGGTTTATASVVVGTVADAGGWTALTPSADSRLIYVSNEGDDVAAANAKGRGYYLPSDDEIGPDPTNPVGPIVAYGSVVEAAKRFRGRNWNGTSTATGIPNYGSSVAPDSNGYPDWLLFRRGETFTMPSVSVHGTSSLVVLSPTELAGNWVESRSRFRYEAGEPSGRSVSERAVIGAWGTPSQDRPFVTPLSVNGSARNMAIVSIETDWLTWSPSRDGNTADNLLIEDVKARSMYGGTGLVTMQPSVLRRCVVSGAFDGGVPHHQGFFLSGTAEFTFEECVFDYNGYKENPYDATTWTAGVVSTGVAGALPAGTGVQPNRTFYDRNLYLSGYDAVLLRGNIFSRDGGGSSVQMGKGWLADRNLFIWNEMALTTGRGSSATIFDAIAKDNVVLHDDHLLPTGGWGSGIQVMGVEGTTHVSDSNVIAHFHRGSSNATASISARGKNVGSGVPQSKLGMAVIVNNAVYQEYGAPGLTIEPTTHNSSVSGGTGVGVLSAQVSGNKIATSSFASGQGDPTKPSTYTYSDNRFFSSSPTPFRWAWHANGDRDWRSGPATDGAFAQWQSAGYDTDGTFTNDFATFTAAAGWTAPERDIVSYMQSVDPTYVVDENVYVDEESAVKQTVRQRVWEVLSDPAKAGNLAMSAERAKQVARRYHAFITFIQRAKANRKGAWDTRWTAEAVNNYIRAGFGKAPITGAYDNRSLATRIAEYLP